MKKIDSKNPFDYFEAIYCINLDRRTDRWAQVQKEFEKVGIQDRVIRFSAVETPENGHFGCMASHRTIIQRAKNAGWKNVLVLEDDIIIRKPIRYFETLFNELKNIKYDVGYLGGRLGKMTICKKKFKNCVITNGISCTHAIIYSENIYDYLLKNIPHYPGIEAEKFLEKYKYFDNFLSLQNNKIILFDTNSSVFQRNYSSDTDGNKGKLLYLRQYEYIYFSLPSILQKIIHILINIKGLVK